MTKYERDTYRPLTLCEVCTKACGVCSWSKKGVQRPVEGWDAIRNDLQQPKSFFSESYIVLRCPEFELEPHNEWAYKKFDPERVRRRIEHRESIKRTKKEKMEQRKAQRAKLAAGG